MAEYRLFDKTEWLYQAYRERDRRQQCDYGRFSAGLVCKFAFIFCGKAQKGYFSHRIVEKLAGAYLENLSTAIISKG